MISGINLTKGYGADVLFEDINFKINKGERIGLVGRNGHGKTTLLRIISGEEHADSGYVVVPKEYKIGYLKQNIKFANSTVLAEAACEIVSEEADDSWKAKKILAGLGFAEEDFLKPPYELSSGYQVRLNLAKVLLSEADMLLLDEPNNYLDITSIIWLANFLRAWRGELILITHDRSFMDKIVTHTIGIHRKRVRKVEGDTSKLYTQIALEEEVHEKTRCNDEKKRKEVELFISRFRAKARLAGLVQSRVKLLEKKETKERLSKIKTLDFFFRHKAFPGKYIMTASNLSFGFEQNLSLFSNLSFTVGKNDRIAVVGPNGKGKTTLLKVLSGNLTPGTGSVVFHPEAKFGYFEQANIANLHPQNSVLDEIIMEEPEHSIQHARDICATMMFERDDVLKKVQVLSGGEKSRLMLGKILVSATNLLMLDEPTNHLDMESADALLEALDEFDGAVVLVSHNEMLLHAIANRLIVFGGEEVMLFEGTYQDFLNKHGWEKFSKNEELEEEESLDKRTNRKETRRQRGEIIAEKSRVLKPLEIRINELETNISRLEVSVVYYNDKIILASKASRSNEITTCSKELFATKKELDVLYSELEEITERYEILRKEYEHKLADVSKD